MGASFTRGTGTGPNAFDIADVPWGGARRGAMFARSDLRGRGTVARKGDIPVGRVGRGLERKVCGIAACTAEVATSMLRLRVPAALLDAVLDLLLSPAVESRLGGDRARVGRPDDH